MDVLGDMDGVFFFVLFLWLTNSGSNRNGADHHKLPRLLAV